MNKAYRYRIYPDKKQEEKMMQTFGSCRFVYNYYLDQQKRNFESGGKFLSRYACNNDCNHTLKEQYPWLREVDKFALTNAIYALDTGFKKFFQKQGGYLKFKSRRHSKMSYTTNYTNNNIKVLDRSIQLPKLGKIKAVIHRPIPKDWKIKQATISRECDDSYYVSILCEYETNVVPVHPVKIIGLDYKSNGLYMDSDGNCCNMPHFYRNNQKKLAKAQRKLRKKELHSNNYEKQQKKIKRIQRKSANQRKDYLHKRSTEIANQFDLVCIENLDMKAMSNKGFGNGKATMDNGYGQFTTMLNYKLQDQGKFLIKVDRWYPSSKTCSCCGAVKDMPLTARRYQCTCGLNMDRDLNAAINIRNKGYDMFFQKAV